MLAKPDADTAMRVLMIYTRTDVHDATVNKKSGERVLIRDIADTDHSVMYGSEMVEREIRQLIREADENVYKKGFVVDAVVQRERREDCSLFRDGYS